MKGFFSYFKKYKVQTILAPLFKMLEATFELFVPKVIQYMIDKGIPDAKLGNYNNVILSGVLLVVLAILGITASLIAQYFSALVAVNVSKEIKHDTYKHIETLSYADIDRLGTSSIITNLTSDTNQVQTGINLCLRLLLRSPFVVFGAAIMSLLIDVKTGLVVFACIPVLALIVSLITILSIPKLSNVQKKLSNLLRKTRENLKGVRVLRAFNEESKEVDSFRKENKDYTSSNIKVNALTSLLNPLTYLVVNATIVIVLYFSSKKVYEGSLTQGNVLALYSYISQILVELIKLSNLIITINKAIACYKRIKEVNSITCSQTFKNESTLNKPNDIAISFKDVSFTYPNSEKPIISNISFDVKKGEHIGIIGSTGSGKTSLISLIPRYYDLSSGSILVNNTNVFDYSKNDLRNTIGIVNQKQSFVPGSLREVVSFGKNYTDDEVIKALVTAQGKNVIDAHQEGLDYQITSGAKNLSGGQRQRVSIARTLIRKPEILILDSATSALDYLTEKNFKRALKSLDFKPTIISVSDRISALTECEKILVLDNGKMAGFDTVENLLNTSSVFREIYYSQNEKEEA